MNSSQIARAKAIEGNHQYEKGQFAQALYLYLEALELDSNYAEVHFNCALTYQALQQLEKDVEHLNQALFIDPNYFDAHLNRGNLLRDLNHFEEAKQSYQMALQIDDQSVQALNNLGVIHYELRDLPKAIAFFEKAIDLEPKHINAHWGLSLCCLLVGDFQRGWEEFEWRLRDELFAKQTFPLEYENYLWQGQSLQDKTILLMAEQGLGDTIQFCRFAKIVKDMGARVVLQVPPTLIELLQGMKGVDQVISTNESAENIDFVIPLMSLPHRLQLSATHLYDSSHYLFADNKKIQSKLLGNQDIGLIKVGLAWQGGVRESLPSTWATHHRRNISLEYLLQLAHPKIVFYNLQKGSSGLQELEHLRNKRQTELMEECLLDDFSDTAAIIAQLDLVITVDTAVAHLAGAMGKPVWVLNRYDACWRWQMGRTEIDWYASMQFYFQKRPGAWLEVIDEVKKDLEVFISEYR
jgi:hypothetical protein